MSDDHKAPHEQLVNLLREEEENLVKRYLLGEADEREQQQVEERLLTEDAYAENLVLIEDELIDDYARRLLSAHDRELFERNFLTTPKRQQKLTVAQSLVLHAATENITMPNREATTPEKKKPAEKTEVASGLSGIWNSLFFPPWKLAAFGIVLLVIGFGAWRIWFKPSEISQGLIALNQAYRQQRPLESRITGFDYAPFIVTRGEEKTGDYVTLDEAEVMLRKAAREKNDAASLYALGKLYLAKKEFDKAIEQIDQAGKKDSQNALLHNDLGVALMEKGRVEQSNSSAGKSELFLTKSLEEFSKALELNGSLSEARFNRALLYQILKLYRQAEVEWETYLAKDSQSAWATEARQNLQLLQELKKKVATKQEQLWVDFLTAYYNNNAEQAWEIFSQSHFRNGNSISGKLLDKLLEQHADAKEQLQALFFIGKIAQQRTNEQLILDQAQFYSKQSPSQLLTLKKARELLASAYLIHRESKNDVAIERYQQARKMFQETGDAAEILLADYGIAYCQFQQSDVALSKKGFEQLALISKEHSYQWIRMMALHGLSMIDETQGNYSAAISHCHEILQIAEQQSDSNSTLRSQNLLAGIYRTLGKHEEALQTVKQALALAEHISADSTLIVGFYMTAAWSLSALESYRAALGFENETIALCEEMNNPFTLARGYTQLGMIQAKLKNYPEAIKAAQKAVEIGEKLQSVKQGSEVSNYARVSLGHFYRDAGFLNESVTTFQQAISFYQENDEQLLLYGAYKGLLLTQIARDDVLASQKELERVLHSFETHRAKILEESSRNSFFDKEQDTCDLAIEFAEDRLADSQKAFEYAERCRGRSLLDSTLASRQMVTDGELVDLRFSTVAMPTALTEIRQQIPTQVQVVQFAVLKDKTIVWLITRDKFERQVLPIGTELLDAIVPNFLHQISHPDEQSMPALLAQATELHRLLIAPLISLLAHDKTLCLVPDKILTLLPFAALYSAQSGKWLLEEFQLLYAPSTTLFLHYTAEAERRAGKKNERLLSVGNPAFDRQAFPTLGDLPAAEKEAFQIAALYQHPVLLTGNRATEEAIRRELEKVDVIHLALHHIPDERSALISRMLLASGDPSNSATDGLLEAHEILQYKLRQTRLVVLSACRTDTEKYYKGEGVIGISRVFEAAGVPLVIASLWEIDSNTTSDLMIHFHQVRKQRNSTNALRDAQLGLIYHIEERFHHPYYWAGFRIVGGNANF
jgi:CHAT domain-containing protein/Flp pilus assembly protein TadD